MNMFQVPTTAVTLSSDRLPQFPQEAVPGWSGPHDMINDLFGILQRRMKLLVVCVLISVAVGLSVSLCTTPRYEATANLDINAGRPDTLGVQPIVPYPDTSALETEVKLLSSSVVLQLATDAYQQRYGGDKQDISRLLADVQVRTVRNTRIVSLTLQNSDPQVAERALAVLIETYKQQSYRLAYTSKKEASDWLAGQLVGLRAELEAAQRSVAEFGNRAGLLELEGSKSMILMRREQLNMQVSEAEANRITKQAAYDVLVDAQHHNNTSGQVVALLAPDVGAHVDVLQRLRQSSLDLKTDQSKAAMSYGPKHPQSIQLTKQISTVDNAIADEENAIVNAALAGVIAAANREAKLRRELRAQMHEARSLKDVSVQYDILKQEATASRDLYQGLMKTVKEAGVIAGLNAPAIRVIDPPEAGPKPVAPNYYRNIAGALCIGLVVGFCLGGVVDARDTTLRIPYVAEQISGLPIIGIVPIVRSSRGRPLWSIRRPAIKCEIASAYQVALHQPQSAASEAFRSIRTSILLARSPHHTILITSATPGEGKTTTSLNVALSLAQQGKSVLLVEGDMRKPSIAKILGHVSDSAGLALILKREVPWRDCVLKHPAFANLNVLPAGNAVTSAPELLGSCFIGDLIAEWSAQFDYVVLDGPPILSATDALLLAAHVDSVLLVVRWAQTKTQSIQRARDLLLKATEHLGGIIVNGVDLKSAEYHAYYGDSAGL